MREIKFRAWLKKEKKIVEVVSVDYKQRKISYEVEQGLIFLDKGLEFRNFEEIELIEYTGLKDKNNREIYERDIVEWLDISKNKQYSTVVYENGVFSINNFSFEFYKDTELKVVGNKFENPELLESD